MNLSCEICGEWESGVPHDFCEKVRPRFQELQERAKAAEKRLDTIQESVLMAISLVRDELPNQETVEIPSALLKQLWESAECSWFTLENYDSFLQREIEVGRVTCLVAELFSKDPHKSRKQILHELSKGIVKSHNTEFPDNPLDTVTTVELVKEIIQENS